MTIYPSRALATTTMSPLFRLTLLGCLLHRLAGRRTAVPPLPLHDFEHTASPTSGVTMSGWTTAPDRRAGQIGYRLEPAQRPDSSDSRRALHLRYRFAPDAMDDIGWQLTLPDLDASAYDHLELWIRGDARVGYADALKLEFKQPLAGHRPVCCAEVAP